MNVIIIEDEVPAADRLKKLLNEISGDIRIVKTLHSFHESLTYFQTNPSPDLLFMDIALGDGSSLELLKQVKVSCPVIFITAYDEYWQEAFELNGIDYLLKPLRKERLQAALMKLNDLKDYFLTRVQDLISHQESAPKFKERFLVKRGNKYVSVRSVDIAYFYAAHKLTFLVEKDGVKYILDHSLSDVRQMMNPDHFFRLNRKYLVSKASVFNIQALPKSKLLVHLSPSVDEELIVSSENSAEFKQWMDR